MNEIVVSDSVVDLSCYESDDGSIALTVSGGVPAYSYVWTNGDATQTIGSLNSSWFGVTVFDDAGCFGMSYTSQLRIGVRVAEVNHGSERL